MLIIADIANRYSIAISEIASIERIVRYGSKSIAFLKNKMSLARWSLGNCEFFF